MTGYPNLVVLRTFSKWAGIAGLRLGYGILPDWLMPVMLRAKQPYNVNVAATVAGLTSLAQAGRDSAVNRRPGLRARALYFEAGASAVLRPYPSCANFVLCRVVGRDAAEVRIGLAAQGILVRYYAKPGLGELHPCQRRAP